jgi:hypothetical protein
MQPFEIIKVRLQTQNKAAPLYNGIADCLTKIVKNEGPLALYKGKHITTQELLLPSSVWVFSDPSDSVCSKISRNRLLIWREKAVSLASN